MLDKKALCQMDDASLLREHVQGTEMALETLIERHRTELRCFLSKFHFNDEVGNDLILDLYIRVDRHAAKFNLQLSSVKSWLYMILDNLAKNQRRNSARVRSIPFADLEIENRPGDLMPFESRIPDYRYAPDRIFEAAELYATVETAIEEMSPEHRELFELRERCGLNYLQLAETTGLNIGTVKSRLSRGREVFRHKIATRLD